MSVRIDRAESAFTGLTGGNPPHLPNLVIEVNANATITTVCHDAQWNKPESPREISLIFDSTPSGPELTELDSTVIPNHTGVDSVDSSLAPSGGLTDVFVDTLFHVDALNRASYPGSGTAVTDIEGLVVGVLTGNATHDGAAFLFDGAVGGIDFVKTAAMDDLFAGAGGTAIWVFNAASDGEANFGRFGSTDGDGLTGGWDAYLTNESGGSADMAFLANFSTTNGTWSIPGYTIGEWAVFAVRYDSDSTANNPDMFLNGTLTAETEDTTPAGSYNSDVGEKFVVGNRDDDDRAFDGQIQRALLFDRSLTDDEIAQVSRTLLNRVKDSGGGGAGGTWVTETIATQTIIGSDTALTATLSNDPDLATVIFKFDGLVKDRGATKTYTLGGTGNRTITWLASSGDAEDMDTNDVIEVTYRIA